MAIGSPTLGAAEPYLIQQQWAEYTPQQHQTWAELVGRRMPEIEAHACEEYLAGFEQIGLRVDQIPNLGEVNQRLTPRSGWRATPVSGFLPPDAFFAMLAARQFPTTTWLRGRDSLEYIPEPDIFHDVFGHVPMHAHPVFCRFSAALRDGVRGVDRQGGAGKNGPSVLVHGGVWHHPPKG